MRLPRGLPEPIVLKFISCHRSKIGIMVDSNLERRGRWELRKWSAPKIDVIVIDSDTGEDITRVFLA